MNIHIYVWKNNEKQLSRVQNRGELINKLLQIYFQKKANETAPIYTEPEPVA